MDGEIHVQEVRVHVLGMGWCLEWGEYCVRMVWKPKV